MKKIALLVYVAAVAFLAIAAINNNTATEDGRFVVEPGAVYVDGHKLATTTQVAVVQSNVEAEASRATGAEHAIQLQVNAVKDRTSTWDQAAIDVANKADTNATGQLNWTGADVRVAEPTQTNQPATKNYVDTFVVEAATNVARWSEYKALQDVDMDGSGFDDVKHVEFDDGERVDGNFVKDRNNLRLGGGAALRLNKPAISGYLGAGRVVAWGLNASNQCDVPELASNDVVAVSGGEQHSLALRSDGRVVAWGRNSENQCNVPADASNSVIAIAGGFLHSLALRSDGRVVAWGGNASSQCSVPSDASNSVVAIACGTDFSLALRSNGRVIAWGDNGYGQCNVPSDASNSVIAIAGGDRHSLALRSDGRVVAWGDTSDEKCDVPELASNSVVDISCGVNHSLALRADGRVIAWGINDDGQIDVPELASNSVISVGASGLHSIVLRSDGMVIVWGNMSAVPSDASNSVIAVAKNSLMMHSLAIRGIQELPEIKTPAIWLPVNGVIYFGTTTNYLRDMNGTNFLFKAGAAEKLMLP